MPRDLLELECPACSARLELDSGFAGSVCRCSLCGALMSVPADPSSNQPRRLTRPDRPPGSSLRTSTSRRSANRGRDSARSSQSAPAAASDGSPPAADEPQIPSRRRSDAGRSPRRADASPAPPDLPNSPTASPAAPPSPGARRRAVARVATYVVFGLVMAIIVGLCLFAAMTMNR